ncbi:hypothetical protein DFP72DRAFT_1101211 [Ephemerocybe angulata]|uniref:Uncharacterized protein n=1 Tax=Ephemerocybe angulata TaxID=980116 RepID=A0A8H6HBV5_9AGAR|nr:hypothetical protein DFP72DRAFT_1101211 [Tulosesus angulatus]
MSGADRNLHSAPFSGRNYIVSSSFRPLTQFFYILGHRNVIFWDFVAGEWASRRKNFHCVFAVEHPLAQPSREIDPLCFRDASPSPETATAPSALAHRRLRPPLDDFAARGKSIRRVIDVQAFKNGVSRGKSIRCVFDIRGSTRAVIATTFTSRPGICTSALMDGCRPTSAPIPVLSNHVPLTAVRNQPLKSTEQDVNFACAVNSECRPPPAPEALSTDTQISLYTRTARELSRARAALARRADFEVLSRSYLE